MPPQGHNTAKKASTRAKVPTGNKNGLGKSTKKATRSRKRAATESASENDESENEPTAIKSPSRKKARHAKKA